METLLAPVKDVSDYMLPSYKFAQSIGLSTSVKGRIILNKKNWNILKPFLQKKTVSVRGSAFDGMVDGHSTITPSIAGAIQGAQEVFEDRGFDRGCVFYADQNELNIGDCCNNYYFRLA